MKIKSKVRAGHLVANHNATTKKKGVKIKSKVRAGHLVANHSATRIRR